MKWILIAHGERSPAQAFDPSLFSFCFPFGNPISRFSFIFELIAIDFINVAEQFAEARNFNDFLWDETDPRTIDNSKRNSIGMPTVRESFQSFRQLFTFLDFHFNASHMFIRYQMICSSVKLVFFVQMCVKIAQVFLFGVKFVFVRPDDRKSIRNCIRNMHGKFFGGIPRFHLLLKIYLAHRTVLRWILTKALINLALLVHAHERFLAARQPAWRN